MKRLPFQLVGLFATVALVSASASLWADNWGPWNDSRPSRVQKARYQPDLPVNPFPELPDDDTPVPPDSGANNGNTAADNDAERVPTPAPDGQLDQPVLFPDGGSPGQIDYTDFFWLNITAADQGLGFEGSYFTVGALLPYSDDFLGGTWWVEARAHISIERGNFFSNLGIGRRQRIDPVTSASLSFWWDYDGDEAPIFGHPMQQVGISGDLRGPWWEINVNGYLPVGTRTRIQNSFSGNRILLQPGLDSIQEGIDGEFGFILPRSQTGLMFYVGGYAYGSSEVESFNGFRFRLERPSRNRRYKVDLQINHDERFGTTGLLGFSMRLGKPPRGKPATSLGPYMRPTLRNDHVVRVHNDPIIARNPDNGDDSWRIFHVDNTAANGGDGTAEMPFNTLEAANQAADMQYDLVLVREGDGTTSGYNTEFAMLANQQLLGDGVEHFINTQNGLFQLDNDLDGLIPAITNTAGSSVVLANGSLVSGFAISGANTAVEANSSLTTTATGDRLVILGGQKGIEVTNSDGEVIFTNTTISNTTQRSVDIDGGAPTFSFTGDITNTNIGGRAIRVTNTGAATDITFNGTITDTGGTGMFFDDVDGQVAVNSDANIINTLDRGVYIMDSDGTFTFANTAVTTNSNRAGVDLMNNTGTISFDDLLVTTSNGAAVQAFNSGTLNIDGGTLTGNGGPAIDAQDTTLGIDLDSLVSNNSSTTGVNLESVAGTFNVQNDTTITNSTSHGINVQDSPGLVADFGTTTVTNAGGLAGNGVNLQNNAGGTFTFNNMTITTTNGSGLVTDDTGTVNFTGTSAAPSVIANGGPVVDLDSATTGQTNGVDGWTFNLLTSNNSSTEGLRLDNLSQDFTVTGATTINGATNTSIEIEGNTNDITFASPVLVTNRNALGISINNVEGDVMFGNTTVDNNAGATGDGVLVQNTAASGSVTFASASVTAADNALQLTDNTGLVAVNGGTISAGDDGVKVDDSNAVIRATSISAGDDAVEVTTGATDRTVTLANNTVTAAGNQGFELNINGAGSLTAVVENNSITSAGDSFDAATAAGSGELELVFNDNTLTSTGGAATDIDGSLGGTITITEFADNQVNGPGAGMLLDTVTFDADAGTVAIEQVDGGDTRIGTTANRVNGDGLSLIDPTGDLRFNQLDIANNGGTGLLVDTKGGGTTFNLDNGGGTIDTTGGAAMMLDPLTVNLAFASVASNGSPDNGVHLDTVDGTISIGETTIINAADQGLLAENSPGLVADFGDTTIATTGSQGTGIRLDSNAGATFTFNDLSITTSAGAGLVTSNGGTVNLTGDEATISATGGAAVELDALTAGQTDGAAGWTFASLASTNSTDNGLTLDGITDDFTVTGATTINNASDHGVSMQNSSGNVTLDTLSVNGAGEDGVHLENNTGTFTVNDSTTVTDAQENGINITNNGSQTADFGDTTIATTGSQGTGINVENSSGGSFTFNDLSITTSNGAGLVTDDGGTVNLTGDEAVISATGGAAVDLDALTTGQTDGVNGWTFDTLSSTNSGAEGVKIDGAAVDVTVTGTTTVTNATTSGISVANTSGALSFNSVNISGSTNGMTTGVLLSENTGSFSLSGGTSTISDTSAAGINSMNTAEVTVDSTTLSNIGTNAMNLVVDGTNTMVARITDNTMASTNDELRVEVAAAGATLCITASGNDATGGNDSFLFINNGNNDDFMVEQPAVGVGNIEDVNNGVTVTQQGQTIDFNVPCP